MVLLERRKKALAAIILVALGIAMIPVFMPNIRVSAQGTKIIILPVENTFYANETAPGIDFIVNVTVVDVVDLQNWQVKLTWNASLLDWVNKTLPTDHVFAGSGQSMIEGGPLNESDSVQYGVTYINTPYWTFNGTGTLCQFAFRIKTPPNLPPLTCNFSLVNIYADTFLLDADQTDMVFTVEDGVYTYSYTPVAASISPSGTTQVNYGGSVDFTASVSDGAPPYAYQWFFKYPNGTEVEATEAVNQTSWTCYPILTSGDHIATVQVTDNLGGQDNASATVRLMGLQVSVSPQSAAINVNEKRTYTATISGGVPPYLIKWMRNGTEDTAYQNMTTATINFTTVGLEILKVSVTDSASTTRESFSVSVTVYSTPTTIVKTISEADVAAFYSNATKVGSTIKFNVTIQSVTDLWTWQIKIAWDPTLLNLTYDPDTMMWGISRPTDHVFSAIDNSINPDAPGARGMIEPTVIVAPGMVTWGCTYSIDDPDYWTFNGTGTLCQLEFRILRQPNDPQSSCTIGLADNYINTFLQKGDADEIPFQINNGTYTYVLVSPVRHQLYGYTFLTYTDTSIIANSTDHNVTEAWIDILDITGAPGSAAFVNFTLPKALIWLLNPTDEWHVYRDGVDVTSQAVINKTDPNNTYIYLAFTFEDYDTVIRVQGTAMVPEQMYLLFIALLIGSLIAVVLAKKFPQKKLLK